MKQFEKLSLYHTLEQYDHIKHSTSFKEIKQENLQKMVQQLNRRNCQGISGIHWDEIYIKDGIEVNVRTNQLIGFEEWLITQDLLTENMYDESMSNQLADLSGKETANDKGTNHEKAKMLHFFWTSFMACSIVPDQ